LEVETDRNVIGGTNGNDEEREPECQFIVSSKTLPTQLLAQHLTEMVDSKMQASNSF
jgi:hypothetical protein